MLNLNNKLSKERIDLVEMTYLLLWSIQLKQIEMRNSERAKIHRGLAS